MGRARANVAALDVVRVLEAEGRPATGDERVVLARWSGWGALPGVFETDPRRPDFARFAPIRERLRELLTDDEFSAAADTTLNAHYTDVDLARLIWGGVAELGFAGGQVLEPGCGAGHFLGTAPSGVRLTGVELDPTTAAITQALYPTAQILAESFAHTRAPEGAFDLTIGNVPFGAYRLVDTRHNRGGHSIHNHFILKALHLTRPGGLVVVLTSRYTLDARNPGARREMAELADLVGAVRLPSGSHLRAAGTRAVMDLLVLRRREDDRAPAPVGWEQVRRIEVDGGEVAVNEYFAEHPERVLGRMHTGQGGGMYREDDLAVEGDGPVVDALAAGLREIAAEARSSGLVMTPRPDGGGPVSRPVAAVGSRSQRQDGYIERHPDGSFTQVIDGYREPLEVLDRDRRELAALLGLRDTAVALLEAEAASIDDPDGGIEALRAELGRRYDAYTAGWGPINRSAWRRTGRVDPDTGDQVLARVSPKQGGFRADPFAPVVYALEHFDAQTQTASRADIFVKRVVGPRPARLGAESAADALAICLDEFAEVRLAEIARLLGVDTDEARRQLDVLVFDDPDSGRLVPAAEYLSGDVRAKLEVAEQAAAHDTRYVSNVDALAQVIPPDLRPEEIRARLGASWIPVPVIQRFLTELLDDASVRVQHPRGSTVWAVRGNRDSVLATSVWGTKAMPAPDLVQAILEQRRITVFDRKKGFDGKTVSVFNPEATQAAQAKAEEIHNHFTEWVWENPARADDLAAAYNRTFNNIVLRSYDGMRLSLPGVAMTFTPRPHQVAAVARIIAEPTVLLAHEVGAGKTAEMVMGCMELRRLGLVAKPCIVVPNHMLEQFRREWLSTYPQAKILAASSTDLSGEGRRRFVGRCATGDWDGIVLTRGAFERIPMSHAERVAYLRAEIRILEDQLIDAKKQDEGGVLTVKRTRAILKRAEARLDNLLESPSDDGLTFEQTGIDYLCIDEAHAYKNLRTTSNIPDAGIDGSARASDLAMKLTYLRKRGGPRVATLATATPIANSVSEAHVMLRYLRPDLLARAGVEAFDAWAATFGETRSSFELSPDGNSFRMKTRFARFANVPELLRMWRVPADVKTAEDLKLPVPDLAPRPDGQRAPEVVVGEPSDELVDYIADLGTRAELIASGHPRLIENKEGEAKEDNMLWVTSHGRAAALDLRLVDGQPGNRSTKVELAADRISTIWRDNRDRIYHTPDGSEHPVRGAFQIVFCDLGTPGRSWNVYDELRDQLIARGMPAGTIRYMHEARNDREKADLFASCNAGQVAVLIGSTETMGVGTNIQTRAVALHHLDCPWRPADVQQREGRILRRGNQNPEVQILRYVTEGSFDAFMWGVITRKAAFIAQIMRGSLDVREIEDIGDAALSYDEVKALATGNPALLEKAEADQELTRLERLERAHHREQQQLDTTIQTGERTLDRLHRDLDALDQAIARHVSTKGEAFVMRVGPTRYSKRTDAGKALIAVMDDQLHQAAGSEHQRRDIGVIGQLGGFDLHATTNRHGKLEITVAADGVPGAEIRLTLKEVREITPTGLITRLENRLTHLDLHRAEIAEAIPARQAEIDRAREQLGKPFGYHNELAATRDRVAHLNQQLTAMARTSDTNDPHLPAPNHHPTAMPDDEQAWIAQAAAHDTMAMAQQSGGTSVIVNTPSGPTAVVTIGANADAGPADANPPVLPDPPPTAGGITTMLAAQAVRTAWRLDAGMHHPNPGVVRQAFTIAAAIAASLHDSDLASEARQLTHTLTGLLPTLPLDQITIPFPEDVSATVLDADGRAEILHAAQRLTHSLTTYRDRTRTTPTPAPWTPPTARDLVALPTWPQRLNTIRDSLPRMPGRYVVSVTAGALAWAHHALTTQLSTDHLPDQHAVRDVLDRVTDAVRAIDAAAGTDYQIKMRRLPDLPPRPAESTQPTIDSAAALLEAITQRWQQHTDANPVLRQDHQLVTAIDRLHRALPQPDDANHPRNPTPAATSPASNAPATQPAPPVRDAHPDPTAASQHSDPSTQSGSATPQAAMLAIIHSRAHGTLLTGTERGDGANHVIKSMRSSRWYWKWSARIGPDGAWYVPGSRGTTANTDMIARTSAALRATGRGVTVTIDGHPEPHSPAASARHEDHPVQGSPSPVAEADLPGTASYDQPAPTGHGPQPGGNPVQAAVDQHSAISATNRAGNQNDTDTTVAEQPRQQSASASIPTAREATLFDHQNTVRSKPDTPTGEVGYRVMTPYGLFDPSAFTPDRPSATGETAAPGSPEASPAPPIAEAVADRVQDRRQHSPASGPLAVEREEQVREHPGPQPGGPQPGGLFRART